MTAVYCTCAAVPWEPQALTRPVERRSRPERRLWASSEDDAGGERVDLSTDEGLRWALRRLPDCGGWNGQLGTAVLAQLRQMCASLARHLNVVYAGLGRCDVDELLSWAWSIADRQADAVTSARHPWTYLRTAVRNHTAEEMTAAMYLTSLEKVRQFRDLRRTTSLHHPVRPGDDDLLAHVDPPPGVDVDDVDEALVAPPLPVSLSTVVDEITDRAGEQHRADIADAVCYVAHHALGRASYQHMLLARDRYLRWVHRLPMEAVRALANLVHGTRRAPRRTSLPVAVLEHRAGELLASEAVQARLDLVAAAYRCRIGQS